MKKLLAAVVLFFCVLGQAQTDVRNLEPLFGFLQDQEGIVIQVFSGGCTHKDDFKIQSVQSAGVIEVSLFRTSMDFCKAYFQYGTNIFFTYEELGVQRGQKFEIRNLIKPSRRANF